MVCVNYTYERKSVLKTAVIYRFGDVGSTNKYGGCMQHDQLKL
jgi:hypothetical protein